MAAGLGVGSVGLAWGQLDLGSSHRWRSGLFHVFSSSGNTWMDGECSQAGRRKPPKRMRRTNNASQGPGVDLVTVISTPIVMCCMLICSSHRHWRRVEWPDDNQSGTCVTQRASRPCDDVTKASTESPEALSLSSVRRISLIPLHSLVMGATYLCETLTTASVLVFHAI